MLSMQRKMFVTSLILILALFCSVFVVDTARAGAEGQKSYDGMSMTGETVRASVGTNGAEGNNDSYFPVIANHGRYIAFNSYASNLVSGDTNGKSDVFVRDIQTGRTTRVSVNSQGVQGNNNSYRPSISADGRYIVFESDADNLVPEDTNGVRDVFLNDLQTGVTTRVSLDSNGGQGNGTSFFASISVDGRFTTFESDAANFTSNDTNSGNDVFLHDMQTGETICVSINADGLLGDNDSYFPSISGDGHSIAFESAAENLVIGDTNGVPDIFVHVINTGFITRISVDSSAVQADGASSSPSISVDGRYIAFESDAKNLVSGDTNKVTDIFVHDMQTLLTTRVSINSSGLQGNNDSSAPSISEDGLSIAFESIATNLAPDDTNAQLDVFVHALQQGTTALVSVASTSGKANGQSGEPSITADGQLIVYTSMATNLVADDTNSHADVFVHGPGVLSPTPTPTGTPLPNPTDTPTSTPSATPSTMYIQILQPNGGEILTPGTTYRISWNSSPDIDKVSLGYKSCDSCLNWIATNFPNAGFYDWNVNVGNTTNTQFKIDITGYHTGVGSVVDRSDNYFTVLQPTSTPTNTPTATPTFTPTVTHPARLYVKWGASGANNGTSWGNSYRDLQSALAAASSEDEIWVAAGTYKPASGANRSATFQLKDNVAVYGGFSGVETTRDQRNPVTNITVLSGDIDNNDSQVPMITDLTTVTGNLTNSYHVVTGADNATLDGFTITAGNADGNWVGSTGNGGGLYNYHADPTLANIIFIGNRASAGGGLSNTYSSPVLSFVTFDGNKATGFGGGMFNYSNSSPALINVSFINNLAQEGGGMDNDHSNPILMDVTFSKNGLTYSGGEGAGMSNYFSSPSLTNVAFRENSPAYLGGGMSNYGSDPFLRNVIFDKNSATAGGAGLNNHYSSGPRLIDVTFSGNTTTGAGGGMRNAYNSKPDLLSVTFHANSAIEGGAMYNLSSGPLLTNVTISGNTADYGGGIVNISHSTPSLTHVTVNNNTATTSGGGMYIYNDSPGSTIGNSIFWGNMGGMQIENGSITLTVSNSIVQGGCPTNGICANVIAVDPKLGLLGNYGGSTLTNPLSAESPAIDQGSDTICPATDQRGMARPQGANCDIGAYEYDGYAAVRYARPAGLTVGECSSWANACEVSYALVNAVSGQEIWTAAGIYKPTGGTDRAVSFALKNGVGVYGGFDGTETGRGQRDPAANETILSGDLLGNDIGFANNEENSYHVVIGSNTDTSAILDGFTIRGGNANGGVQGYFGGGIYNASGSPTLTNLTFSGNSATYQGGGMYNSASGSPTLIIVTFSGNTAEAGGGMYNASGSPTLTDVIFSTNSASSSGGGMYNGSSTTLMNVTFSNNTASAGGGMYNYHSSTTLTNVTFSGNAATNRGGGIYNSVYSSPALTNVTFSGNTATSQGGGMYNIALVNPRLTNVTFSGNSAASGGGIQNAGNNSPVIDDTILWGDGTEISNGTPIITDSVVQGGCPSGASCTNVIDADPLLGSLQNNGGLTQTLALGAGSSAIDAGGLNSTCATTDQRGVVRPQAAYCDIGAYEYVPTTPSLIYPIGGLPSWDHSFHWTGISTATWYELELQTSGGVQVFDLWYTTAQAGCESGTACAVTPAEAENVANGSYQWRVRDYGSYGYGNWTAFLSFTPPAALVLGAPSGTLTNWDHSFHWTGLSAATYYYVIVETSAGTPVFDAWYTSAEAGCAGGATCAIAPSQALHMASRDYRWRVLDYGPYGYGNWTSNKSFSLNMPPATAGLGKPSGTETSWDHSFHWSGFTDSTWYYLVVQTSGGTTVFDAWYTNAEAGCGSGTNCTIAPIQALHLVNGDYQWKLLDYGPYGYGSWTTAQSFTLSTPPVGGIPGAPSRTLTSWDHTFSWTGYPDSSWYFLQVQKSDGTPVFDAWYTNGQSGCDTDTSCVIAPAEALRLANGDYQWRILDYGSYGYGSWTPFQSFTLNIPPAVVVLGAPKETLTSWDGSFRWTGIPDGTWYLLEVQDGNGTTLLSKWYSASGSCTDQACVATPEETLALPNGTYQWRILDYSSTYGYGSGTALQPFSLNR
jgi:predicted outer membrane repeat protein